MQLLYIPHITCHNIQTAHVTRYYKLSFNQLSKIMLTVITARAPFTLTATAHIWNKLNTLVCHFNSSPAELFSKYNETLCFSFMLWDPSPKAFSLLSVVASTFYCIHGRIEYTKPINFYIYVRRVVSICMSLIFFV